MTETDELLSELTPDYRERFDGIVALADAFATDF